MEQPKLLKNILLSALFSTLAVLLALIIYSPSSFMMDRFYAEVGDAVGHYSSFQSFVTHPPEPNGPGWTRQVMYPVGTSMVFLDAFPGFAWFVRLLPKALIGPDPGAWVTMYVTLGFMLLAALIAILSTLLAYPKNSLLCSTAAGFLAAFWPVHIGRTQGHLALSLMYLEAGALVLLYLCLVKRFRVFAGIALVPWCAIAAGTHPYHSCIILMFTGLTMAAWTLIVKPPLKTLAALGAILVSCTGVTLATWWMFSAFPPPKIYTGRSGGLSLFVSKPVAVLIDPDSLVVARFLKLHRHFLNLAWEGRAFVGTLAILAALLWYFSALRKRNYVGLSGEPRERKIAGLAVAIGVLFTLFCSWGFQPWGGMDSWIAWISPLRWLLVIDPEVSMFRALGRLTWPFCLFAFAAAGAHVAWRRPIVRVGLVGAMLVTSYFEFYPALDVLITAQRPANFLDPKYMEPYVRDFAEQLKPTRPRAEVLHFFPWVVGGDHQPECASIEDSGWLRIIFQISSRIDIPITGAAVPVIDDQACKILGGLWKNRSLIAELERVDRPANILVVSKHKMDPVELAMVEKKYAPRMVANSKELVAFFNPGPDPEPEGAK